ncbi:MAG TPA: DUF2330 domain-containing protein [Fimbriimonadaceae bacterium]|nr:DUF2330 domain-containing protein [Fimbriimonadaceae bacterium]
MRCFTAALLVATGSIATACCISYGEVAKTLAKETAVIFWDQDKKVEHFIRKAEFEGEAEDFGFIFPSPTQPFRIEVADERIFGMLESMKPRSSTMGCSAEEAAKSAHAGSVEVLEQKRVGDYDVTVLKATDGAAMGEWLSKNGHKMRPAMVPWFDHYAKRDWVFTAFKYAGKGQLKTKAVAISFNAETPHYPYRMPADTFEGGHHRPLDLFVVSQTEMDGCHNDGSSWPGEKQWTADASRIRLGLEQSLNKSVKSDPITLPDRLIVTRFKNSPKATNYDMDLTFPIERNVPIWPFIAGAAVVIGFRRAKRSEFKN